MEIRIAVYNATDPGGLFFTPAWFGLHDGGFDLFDVGASANESLERIAEDGDFSAVNAQLAAEQADAQSGAVLGDAGPIAPGELADAIVTIDPETQTHLTLAAMVLPSNDAFIGVDDAISLFSKNGRFAGEQNIELAGEDIYDAGTELNTELDAAFLNQTAPNTGVDENEVVRKHPGFNGSQGFPDGQGDQNILGGVNALGQPIDPEAADFTRDGFEVATLHVNVVERSEGSSRRDFIHGGRADDIVEAGAGSDWVWGGRGWDMLSGEAGDDRLFGGAGSDILDGGEGKDKLYGGRDSDFLLGGEGRDQLFGGRGADVLDGEGGDDFLVGGRGGDLFRFSGAFGDDVVKDFDVDSDRIAFVGGPASLDDVEVSFIGHGRRASTVIEYGDESVTLIGVDAEEFAEAEISFDLLTA